MVLKDFRIDSNGLMGLGVTPTSHNNTTAFQIYDDYNSQGYPRIRLTNQSTGTTTADGYEISLDGSNLHAVHRQRENADIYFMTNNVEKLRITSTGQILVNATTVNAGGATPKMAVDVGDSNLHGLTIQAGGGENNGDLAGIAFGHGNTGDIARPKAAIAHNRTASYGIGDLCFYVDGAGDNNAVSSGDERLRIKSNGTVNIGTNNQASGDSSSKLRVGQAAGSDVGIVVIGNSDSTTPALVITNWDGAQTSNKSFIHFDNSGWGSHQIGSLAGSDGFGIYDDSVLRMSINNVGNTTFHTTGHIVLPIGTTAQRVNSTGALRYNSGNGNLEFYNGVSWRKVQLISYAPTNGLIAYWPFSSSSRSGTTYNDDSGNNHHLTVNGTITDDTTETKFNGCIDFGTADGNHYLKSSSNSFADLDATSGYSGVSISVWVKTSGTQNQWIISEGTVNTRWNYFNEAANAPKWRSVNGGDVIQTGSILTGNWHHLVVTWNSSNNLVQHYRDGAFTNSGTTNVTPVYNGDYLLVGQHSSLTGNASSYRWRGKMAHMRIYNRVLSSSEVSLLYNEW